MPDIVKLIFDRRHNLRSTMQINHKLAEFLVNNCITIGDSLPNEDKWQIYRHELIESAEKFLMRNRLDDDGIKIGVLEITSKISLISKFLSFISNNTFINNNESREFIDEIKEDIKFISEHLNDGIVTHVIVKIEYLGS